jgi:hypothetical protein
MGSPIDYIEKQLIDFNVQMKNQVCITSITFFIRQIVKNHS